MRVLSTCGAIIRNESGQILVIRRSKTDKYRPLQWDLPGGHVEPDEAFTVAVCREVHEETGLDISQPKPELIYATSGVYPDVTVTWLFFRAQSKQTEVILSYEHDDLKWVRIDEAIELIEYEPKQAALVYVHENGLLDA